MIQAENFIFYQIYPKSFCDSNGDGIGDLAGIQSKIGYLKDLGINAIWLTPCYESPNVDNGYDVANYRKISEEVGGNAAFEKLLHALHENGIKLIVDLVANHTSDQHAWFLEAKKSKDNPYRNYYIWRETPPNDWQSLFGGSAWEYDERTKEYYLHSYAVEQPDLNWENPAVRQEIQNIVDYWIKKGVDGFRCDVLDQISKDLHDPNGNGNGPMLHPYIRELFGRNATENIFTVGECWAATADNVKLFCDKDRKELTTVFTFQHLCLSKNKFTTKKPSLKDLCKKMASWQQVTQEAGVYNTSFLENHDQPRSVSRFGNDTSYRYESATLLGGLTLLQRGIPFLFQGQEIGITNSRHDALEAFNDVETLNYFKTNDNLPEAERFANINAVGRDNARRPIPWTAKTEKSWIAPYARSEEINVEKDLRAEKPVFAFYRDLITLRKTNKAISHGTFTLLNLTDEYYAFQREYGEEKITVLCAFERGARIENAYGGAAILNNYSDYAPQELKPYQLIVLK
ncbi:MAG: alpha-glucosidase [Clostridia bacterium]|nr:alpha-glucosidase [Clostridia bacterium]